LNNNKNYIKEIKNTKIILVFGQKDEGSAMICRAPS
jgi:hypothetical protein